MGQIAGLREKIIPLLKEESSMNNALFWTPVMRSLGWTANAQENQTMGAPLLGGNMRFVDLSGRLLGAHVAHAGLIVLWAGAMTLFELSRLNPDSALQKVALNTTNLGLIIKYNCLSS